MCVIYPISLGILPHFSSYFLVLSVKALHIIWQIHHSLLQFDDTLFLNSIYGSLLLI